MPQSMTGFARSEYRCDWGTLSCEIKSVNHRYLDIYFRLPETLRDAELDLRQQIKSRISRGKCECSFKIQTNLDTGNRQVYDEAGADAVIAAAESVAQKLRNPAPINPIEILNMPGVSLDGDLDPEQLRAAATSVLAQALDQHAGMRQREGAEMAQAIVSRINSMDEQIALVKQVLPGIRQALHQRLRDRIEQLDIELEQGRLEQELVIQAQKMDVAEEVDRLESHLAEVRRTVSEDTPVGRRLDFLMQELNREANTLASKSQAVESTNVAVELKVLIEQMREQIQNLE